MIALIVVVLGVVGLFVAFVIAGVRSEETEAQKQQQMYTQCIQTHTPSDCRYILPEAN